MDGDKMKNVRFRVVEVKDKISQKGQKKYRVDIEGVDKIAGLFDDRHDLQVGASYVCESVESSEWTPPKGGSPITTYFTNGKTVEAGGSAPAPQQEAPPQKAPERAPDVYERLQAIVKVAKGIKDRAQDETILGKTRFDAEDIRTMLIQAYRDGAVMQLIGQDRRAAAQAGAQAITDRRIADEDDLPF